MGLTILLLNAVATLAMVGLIWFVQIVHYPLMAAVGETQSRDYHGRHQRLTGFVAGPLMIVEAGTAVLLLAIRPDGVPLAAAVTGVALIVVLWLSTFLLQVPVHRKLAGGHRPELVRRLVRSNWLRTAAWSARGVVVVWMLAVAS